MSTAEDISGPENRNSTRRILLDEVLSILRQSAQKFFAERVAPLVNDVIDQLGRRQNKDDAGISLTEIECRELALKYGGVVRQAAGHYCKELTQAVVNRQGVGDEEKLWIIVESEQFVDEKISRQTAQEFFWYAISSYYLIKNQNEAEIAFCDALAHTQTHTRFLMLVVDQELAHAAALHPPALSSEAHLGNGSPSLSRIESAGKFCITVISELRRIRHSYPASNMVQIKAQYPDFTVWAMFNNPVFDVEDRDIFYHPNQWGATVGYGVTCLAKLYGKSPDTIKRWRKRYRKHCPTQA